MDKTLKIILGLVFVFTFIFIGAFALTNTASAMDCSTGTITLRVGSRGPAVVCLQVTLDNGIVADGIFGPKTKARVVAWQASLGLSADGIFGPKSRAALVATGSVSESLPVGCTSTSLFNTSTGQSCANTIPTGCTSTFAFSITTGLSCVTGLPAYVAPKISGGGSSGPSIQAINNPTISGVTIPLQGETPVGALASTSEYTATISWTGSPSVFLASTSYTATITLTPKSNYTLTGVGANFFTVAGATATNSIDSGVITAIFPATPLVQLTISSPTITTSKPYDGNTGAVVSVGTLSGIIGSETVTVSAVATYDTKNVGTTKTITVVYTLGGADALNYIKPADYTVSTGEITQILLTISNPTLTTSKQYDRTNTAVVTVGSLIGVIGADDVTASAIATYDTPSVNTGKTITVVYTLSGVDALNYIKPVDRIVYSGIISQKQLIISNPISLTLSKLYDRSTSVAVTIGTLSGVIGTEDVTVSGVATYDNANVGTGKTITIVYTLSGAEAANYLKPVNYTTSSGVITAIQLTIPAPTLTTTKEYDANTIAVVTAGALSGILSPDVVTVSAVANYDTALPGTSKTITVVYTLAGAQAGNYTKPIDYTTATGVITAIVINTPAISGVTAPVTDATPVSTLPDGTGYTAGITWSGSPVVFANTTVYTATITLTPATGYTLTGVSADFFTVSGATATNTANTGVVSAVFPMTQAYATAPSAITLAVGSTAPVGGVTNVAIPAIGGTDTTGVITGWVPTTADKIKFTVTDAGSATSTITINGGAYTSGADYQVVPISTFPTIVVTTTETNRTTTVRTFIITGPILGPDGLAYGIVVGADSKKWLDRNLGATQVATAFNDYQSYGSLFQWGRPADGHQLITHTTSTAATAVNGNTVTLSASDTPPDALFIKNPSSPYDWRSPQNGNLWQGVSGVNNPCPAGFRLPISTEWSTLATAAGITNSATAYSSSLKLTLGGYRLYSDASLSSLGSSGTYWSSSVSGAGALYLFFYASSVNPANAYYRANGFTVRCVKD